MVAAAEKNIPIIVPGWEDATLGNMYAAACMRGDVKKVHTVRTGIEYMIYLSEFYQSATRTPHSVCSKSAAVLPVISRSAWFRCSIRICKSKPSSGAISARSRIRLRATALTRAPCRTKRSLGVSWHRYAEVYRRVRCDNRRSADLRLRARSVISRSPLFSRLPGILTRWHGLRSYVLLEGQIMARKVADCRDYPSEKNCTLTISGEEDEVVRAASEHAVSFHGHEDKPELRTEIRKILKDETPMTEKTRAA